MQLIGASLDSINSFARSAIEAGQKGAEKKTSYNPLGNLSGLDNISADLINQVFGSFTPEATPPVATPATPATPAPAAEVSLASLLGPFTMPASSFSLGADLNSLLAASREAVKPSDPALVQETAKNIGITKAIQAQNASKTPIIDVDTAASAFQVNKDTLLPSLTPLFSVADFSSGRAVTSNGLAPATVGTSYDLNFLQQLGLAMAASDPTQKLSSFGVDPFVTTTILQLPGISPVAPATELTKSIAQLDAMLASFGFAGVGK